MNNPSPSPSPQTSSPRRWFEGLNGLRAIAALLIVVDHSAESSGLTFHSDFWGPYLARLDIGVSIFFALSGLLLFYPFVMAQLTHGNTPAAAPFLFRRFVRIYPGYWIALLIVLPLGLSDPVRGTVGHLMTFGLVHTYSRDPGRVFSGITQSWSLVTEIGFYLALPFLAWVGRRLGKKHSLDQQAVRLLLWCSMLAFSSLIFRVVMFKVSKFGIGTWGSISVAWTPSYLDLFAAGMGLAVLSAWSAVNPSVGERLSQIAQRTWIWWSLAALLFWAMCSQLPLAKGLFRASFELEVLRQSIYGLIGICLIVPIVFARPRSTPFLRFLDSRVMDYLGIVSYGIYLWHKAFIYVAHNVFDWPELTGNFWVILAFSTFGSIAAAGLSHRLVEDPLTKMGKRFLQRSR